MAEGPLFAPFSSYSSAKLNEIFTALNFNQSQMNGILKLKKDANFKLEEVEYSSARKMNSILDTDRSVIVIFC